MEVNCLICDNSFLLRANIKTESSNDSSSFPIYSSNISEDPNRLFQMFCKYMNVEEPNFQWLDQPFCPQCSALMQTLSQFDSEIETLLNKTRKIATDCTASILRTFNRGVAESDIVRNRPVHEIRKQIFNRYNPQVELSDSLLNCMGDVVSSKADDCQGNPLGSGNPSVRLNPLLADSYNQMNDVSSDRAFSEIKWDSFSSDIRNGSDIDPLGDNATGLLLEEYISCQDIIAACEAESNKSETEQSPNEAAKTKEARSEYPCTKCPPNGRKTFNSRQALKGHMERNHGGGIDCPQCQSHLSCKSAYYRHLRVVHDKTTKVVGKNRKTVSISTTPPISATKDLEIKDHAHPLISSRYSGSSKTEVRKKLKIQLKMSDVYHDQYRIAN